MKILHINFVDIGGAAIAALRLHNGLLQMDVDSKFLVLHKTNEDNPQVYAFYQDLKSKFKKLVYKTHLYKRPVWDTYYLLKAYHDKYSYLSFPYSLYDLHKNALVQKADIIHLHWVSGFLDYPSFFKFINKPIVWTLHDMNPFSGIFHYDYNVPVDEFPRLNAYALEIKKKAYKYMDKDNFIVNCPSIWLKNRALESNLMKNIIINHIPYGAPTEVFYSMDKKLARQKLDIDQNKMVMLFVSASISLERKGFDLIADIFTEFMDIYFIAVGEAPSDVTNDHVHYLGTISDSSVLRLLYCAAEAFILPSRQDNLPNTMLESMACGTPVIGANVGGIPDLIKHGVNGLLFESGNQLDLAKKIRAFTNMSVKSRSKMSKEAEDTIKRSYKLKDQAKAYMELYSSLLIDKFSN